MIKGLIVLGDIIINVYVFNNRALMYGVKIIEIKGRNRVSPVSIWL